MIKEYIYKKFVDKVLSHMRITSDDLFERSKEKHLVIGRQLLFLLCNERGMSDREIQKYLERSNFKIDLPSIRYGINKAKEIRKQDQDFDNIFLNLNEID